MLIALRYIRASGLVAASEHYVFSVASHLLGRNPVLSQARPVRQTGLLQADQHGPPRPSRLRSYSSQDQLFFPHHGLRLL